MLAQKARAVMTKVVKVDRIVWMWMCKGGRCEVRMDGSENGNGVDVCKAFISVRRG